MDPRDAAYPTFTRLFNIIQANCITGPCSDFLDNFFPRWEFTFNGQVLRYLEENDSLGRYDILREPPQQQDLPRWLAEFADVKIHDQPSVWRHAPGTGQNDDWMTGTRLVMLGRREPLCWEEVDAVGYASDGNVSYQVALTHLYSLAATAMAAQPLRHFIHGFFIHNSVVEFWHFDHSGMSASTPLHLGEEYADVLTILFCYGYKTHEDLGRQDIVDIDNSNNMLYLYTKNGNYELDRNPFVRRHRIFGAALACYRARREQSGRQWTHVVKFKWRESWVPPEEAVLKTIREKKIPGMVSLVHDEQITTIADLRREPCARLLRRLDRGDGEDPPHPGQYGIDKHSTATKKPFINRVFTCLVFTPIGTPLDTFTDNLELLHILRDAIHAHRALLQDANILHRDISQGNIVICRAAERRRGVLIDLDNAIDLAAEQPRRGSMIGTTRFMAIGVQRRSRHTYRHDLESFLYLLLQVVGSNRSRSQLSAASRLAKWDADDFQASADAKEEDMRDDGFRRLLDEWMPEYAELKPVAWRLRDLIFGEEPELWLGTDVSTDGTNRLYNDVLAVFDEAIFRLAQG
ncbi:hypothetical protein K4F52_006725 [Lecanicillium sp. MT-2017a]|nr:hypothetical protein K4F52_006725 [Lecanicillium sp. MT-2017a]